MLCVLLMGMSASILTISQDAMVKHIIAVKTECVFMIYKVISF